jgi:membrane associated rhomboid family serine protease
VTQPPSGPPSGPPAYGTNPTDDVPVCPRHPDRVSYVRCQRCERPVCPECQRPAAVGFQCVDCVAEQAKTVRSGRTTFGGQVQRGGRNATTTIIGICVAVYILQRLGGIRITRQFMFVPAFALQEPWTFLTSAFLHSPNFLLHIVFNMYALWLGGPYLESLLGRARFIALYLLAAVGGSVGLFLLATPGTDSRSWWTGAVGASGAVFGTWGAIMVFNRRLGRNNGGMIVLLLINAAIGFAPGLSIAWQAHLGGLVTGVLAGAVLAYTPREHRARWHPIGLAGIGVLLVVLVMLKVATVPVGLL